MIGPVYGAPGGRRIPLQCRNTKSLVARTGWTYEVRVLMQDIVGSSVLIYDAKLVMYELRFESVV